MANANPAYYLSRLAGGPAYKPDKSCRPYPILNGVSQYASGSFQNDSQSFFVEVDIFPLSIGSIRGILVATNSTYIRLNSDGSVRFRFENESGGVNQTATVSPVTVGVWTTIRLEATASQMKVFVNGVLDRTTNVFSNYDLTKTFNHFGSASGFAYFHGGIKSLNFNDSLVLPLDDGFANNPTARNTAGPDWTFSNMTEAAWGEFCE